MITLDVPIRPEPPLAGDETATLLGSLERLRRTFSWKCSGLGAEALRQALPPSSMTIGGLIKHLALVEDEVNTLAVTGAELGAPWDTADWDADPDWEWHSAASDSPAQLYDLWQDAVARSREAMHKALVDEDGLDHAAATSFDEGTPSIRRLMIDLIEVYARHIGHADLIRESIDGLVGEDPPDRLTPAWPSLGGV